MKMDKKPKLELLPNKPTEVTIVSDVKSGTSTYGEWHLYNLRNGDGTTEYSFFPPPQLHEQLKDLKKGTTVIITKLVNNKNNKIVTTYDVQIPSTHKKGSTPPPHFTDGNNPYLTNILQSFADAIKVREKYEMANVNQLAVTMFIQRTKANGI